MTPVQWADTTSLALGTVVRTDRDVTVRTDRDVTVRTDRNDVFALYTRCDVIWYACQQL